MGSNSVAEHFPMTPYQHYEVKRVIEELTTLDTQDNEKLSLIINLLKMILETDHENNLNPDDVISSI